MDISISYSLNNGPSSILTYDVANTEEWWSVVSTCPNPDQLQSETINTPFSPPKQVYTRLFIQFLKYGGKVV
jgi:hypothetical protein